MRTLVDTHRRIVVVLVSAAALSAALIAASRLSSETSPEPVAARPVASIFAGIPQDAVTLGRDDAPVTLVEYADLQCPYCAEWATRTMPVLVDDYVRTGKLRIVFQGLAFLGPDSVEALDVALAAGRDGKLFDVVHALYANQGAENAGWVTDDLVDRVARDVGLDPARLREDASTVSVERAKVDADVAAKRAGVRGTPSFQIGRTGGELELVQLESLGPDGLRPAIDALLGE